MIQDFVSYLLNVRMYKPQSAEVYSKYLLRVEGELGRPLFMAQTTSEIDEAITRLAEKRESRPHVEEDRGAYYKQRVSRLVANFFKWVHAEGVIYRNPYPQASFRCANRINPRPIPEAQVAAILGSEAPIMYRAMFSLMLDTGIRRSDVRVLKVGDLDLERGEVRFVTQKTGKYMTLPITEYTVRLIQEYLATLDRTSPWLFPGSLPNQPISYGLIQFIFARLGRMTGGRVTAHMVRHTTGTMLYEGGVDIFLVSSVLGHANVTTTKKYVKVGPKRLRSALDQAQMSLPSVKKVKELALLS